MEEEYDIEKILNMFEEDFVIPASKMQRPQSALDREMFEDFNKRNPQADGGRIRFGRGTNLDRAAYKEIRPITQANIDNYTYFTSKEAAKPYKFKVQLPSGTEVFKTKKEAQAAIDASPVTNRDYTEGLIKSKLPEGAVEFDAGRIKIPTGKFVGEGRDKAEIFKIQNKDGTNPRYTAAGAGGGQKKLYKSIEEVKKAKLPPDELVKIESKRIKENIQEITYKNKRTGKITKFYKPFLAGNKVTIPGQGAKTLKEAEEFVKDYFKANPKQIRVRDPEKDYRSKDIRRQFEKDKQGRTIKFGAKKGYTAHHMLPLAGKADVTDSDIAIISNKMNAELAQFDKPMNALVNEAYALDFSKEGSLKRMNEINQELADIVAKAEKKLPKKYKGLIGFNKLTPVLDTFDAKGNQVFDVEVIGVDYKKSIGGKKTGTPLRDIETKKIRQMVSEAPTFRANPFFDPSLMGKVIGDMASSLGSPTAIIGLNTAFGVDPRSSLDRAILGTEAALAPAGIKALTSRLDAIKNPTVRKGIETLAGLRLPGVFTPANVMRAARFASPLGIATLAGEGLYQLGKLGYKEQQMINEMRENDPEAYQRYLAEQQELMDVSA